MKPQRPTNQRPDAWGGKRVNIGDTVLFHHQTDLNYDHLILTGVVKRVLKTGYFFVIVQNRDREILVAPNSIVGGE